MKQRDDREVERRELSRARNSRFDHLGLGRGSRQRVDGAVQAPLLALGAFELDEDALVFDGAQHEAAGGDDQPFFATRERFARLAVDNQHTARLSVLERGAAHTAPTPGLAA